MAIECDEENRRVLFFCACEVPKGCHRYEVGRLLLKAAKRRGADVEIVEWPGGEPQELRERVSEDVVKKMQKGVQVLPLPAGPDLAKYAGLPWGSIVEITADSHRLFFISGPAIYKKGQWGLPVVSNHDLLNDPREAREKALQEYRLRGYDSRTSIK